VSPEEAMLAIDVETSAPPQVAWEFLTTPGERASWQIGVTDVTVTGATGGRRGPGATNHCMHGKDVALEEILDWRPYDYVTDRTIFEVDGLRVRSLHTIELEPTATGTAIHFRWAAPKVKREREAMERFNPGYEAGFRSTLPTLAARLEAAREAVERGAAPEPELPTPNANGPLAGIQPLLIVG